MLGSAVDAETPEELYRQYVAELVAVIDDVGEERVLVAPGLDPAHIESVRGGGGDISLETAAAFHALREDRSAAAIRASALDDLLLGMSIAVLDVEMIAADVEGLDPGEVQAKIEGRYPMTLREFATLRHYIDGH